ncbi:putative ABC transporter periplasmic substrate-binding protein [Pusillimonas sp. T7-7]|uniref:ABC transporter substrate-binding protein n=1 Tax=Pusillimonas sp. (strain T7-7) TaxID=1007105 RepID=UPI00020847B8|nr:ABC transporter substrate-binding protein [Pusillimonas sp. T7-7]AEC21584.1 putative ABC transporter periplasmic substrate-binding protein [Pusillimonas sp. T7-7]
MKTKKFMHYAAGALCAIMMAGAAHAETDEVTLARQFGIGYLPLTVMNINGLVQKQLKEAGLTDTKVTWSRFGSGSAANDALLSGQLNFAAGGTGPAIILWDKTRTNVKVHGVAALSSMPNMLVSIAPEIKSIEDFTDKDKIAMAGAGSSVQTVYLQMAAAKKWGLDNYKKLNPLMVNLPHPEGLNAVLSGSAGIRSTFTSPPFQYMALENEGVHVVLNSYDIMGGPTTFLMVWGTDKFRTENPKTYKAVLAALNEATDWINANPREAAELYVKDTGGKDRVEFIEKMVRDPQIRYKLAPDRILPFAQFMNDVGTIKNRPEAWSDLFFPEIHDLKGS